MLKNILAQSINHTQPKGEKNSRPRKLPNLPLTPQEMMVSPLVSLSCCIACVIPGEIQMTLTEIVLETPVQEEGGRGLKANVFKGKHSWRRTKIA